MAVQVSEQGLIEMTRQRVRPSLYHTQTEPCATCGGTGGVFTTETVVRRNERALRFFEHTAGFKRDMKTAKTTALGAIRIEEVRLKRDLG